MPAKTTRDTLARQWELLKAIPAKKPGRTALELTTLLRSSGFEVQKRQVERDLSQLSTLFPLACDSARPPQRWHWLRNAGADLPGLTLADALSLRLVEDLVTPLLPATLLKSLAPRFAEASGKLDTLAEANPAARWKDKVRTVQPALSLLPPLLADGLLETLQEALLRDLQLDTRYRPPHSEAAKALRLHPLALVQRGPVAYLVATAFEFQDIRLYAAHRFETAALTEAAAQRPESFDLDAYIAQGALNFGNGDSLALEALVGGELAWVLWETPLSADQVLKPDGDKVRLWATVADSWQFRWWLLGQGSKIVVEQPAWLRQEIMDEAQRMLGGYL